MALDFLERLAQGPILCDGAMGTYLYSKGVPLDRCFDALNLDEPALVEGIHREYIAAGAEIVETNTFGANRFKLAEYGLERQVAAINEAGVRAAQRARTGAGHTVFIAGSVGPLGAHLAPIGTITPEEAFRAFAEQVQALAEAGADLLILETFSDLAEMEVAIRAARSVCDLPIVAQMTFAEDRRTPLGYSPEAVVERLRALEVPVIGANCSVGPARLFAVVRRMASLLYPEGKPLDHPPFLAVQPNAGWPERVGGRVVYPATPEYFGHYARRFIATGVQLIGGCCGTTPAHTRAMRLTLNALALTPRPARIQVLRPPKVISEEPAAPEAPTEMQEKLAQGRFVVSVEMSPPKGLNHSKVLAGALMLKEVGADVINVADSPMARMRMSPWAICHLIQSQVGIETVLHFPTRGRNLLRVQSDLLAIHALGIRNLFVVMGDPPAVGDYPQASDHYDVVPSGLVRLIKQNFNQGRDHAGTPLGRPCAFHVGVALNLGTPKLKREMRVLKKKVDAGADFALTQPVYDVETVHRFLRRYAEAHGPLQLPLLVGILPLYSARQAEFLHHEVPGLIIPDEVRRQMRLAGDRGREVGVKMAQDLLLALREVVHGVYIMPPLGRYDMAAEVIGVLGREAEQQEE